MLLCLSLSFSILGMKMLAKASAIFVSMTVPWVEDKSFSLNWNEFSSTIRLTFRLKTWQGLEGFEFLDEILRVQGIQW